MIGSIFIILISIALKKNREIFGYEHFKLHYDITRHREAI